MSLPPGAARMTYNVRFWGTRGSIPTPGPQTARYGGNTACVSVSGSDGRLVILDAGSGLRPLGHELMVRRNGAIQADVLLSHTHWDHIQGLPFFKPLSAPGNRFCISAPPRREWRSRRSCGGRWTPWYFPCRSARSPRRFRSRRSAKARSRSRVHGQAFRLRHPGTTLGFRLAPADGGKDFAYVTDNELGDGARYRSGPIGAAT